MRAFATSHGPFAVALDAAGPAWKHYLGGVLRSCCNLAQEHAPTVVGWGTEVEGDHIGGQYWCVPLHSCGYSLICLTFDCMLMHTAFIT